MFDVCVVGHITKDIVKIGNETKMMPGGTAYYASIALKRLGANVCVATKVAKEDLFLLDELKKEKIPIFLGETPKTTIFTNIYHSSSDEREQRVKDIASPFSSKDVKDISSKVFHLGPLSKKIFL